MVSCARIPFLALLGGISILTIGGGAVQAGPIPTVIGGGSNQITVDNGLVTVTVADNHEQPISSSAGTDNVTGVVVQFVNYWTSWSDNPPLYGNIGSVLSVGPGGPGTITFTAPAGFVVVIDSIDLVGSDGHGSNLIPDLVVGTFHGTNLSFNAPTHYTLSSSSSPVSFSAGQTTGAVVSVVFTDPTGDYGWEGINNITFHTVQTPEPASLSLLAIGGAALMIRRRRKA